MPRRPSLRRVTTAAIAFVVAFVGVLASPAFADPAAPTDHRSVVDELVVAPGSPKSVLTDAGFELTVLGGDSFLEMRIRPGHRAVVYAYDGSAPDGRGEPFLRITGDGTVEENRRSPYTYLIADRYGTTGVPDGLDAADEPEWVAVAGGGRWAWHDHRIHWMSPTPKAGVEPGDVVLTWEVPFEIDGVAVTAHGTLRKAEPVAVPVVAATALVAFVVVVVVGRRALDRAGGGASVPVVLVGMMAAAAVAGLLVGGVEVRSLPGEARPGVLAVVLPAVATVAAIVGLVRRQVAAVAVLAAVACLAGWVLLRRAVLTRPVLPTDLPAGLDRSITAVVAGAVMAAAVVVIRSGALAPDPGPAAP